MNPLSDELGRSPRPCTLVIFGATGDLTRRKLVPALAGLARDGLLPAAFAVVGFARRDKSDEQFRQEMTAGVDEFGREGVADSFAAIVDHLYYHQATFEDADGYARLGARLRELDAAHGTRGNRIFYLATPPSAYSSILAQLAAHGLSQEEGDQFARVVIEKPFGRDRATAAELNSQVAAAFHEGQVFRIDHYLGKETVQNILALRFANRFFEPWWDERHVDHVQITVAESIGVGGRARYFEEAGILRDMIQNHLLQVLTLIAMEPPVSLEADAVRDEKVKVLRAIRSFEPDAVARCTMRGQYTPGFVGASEVRGYHEETDVAPGSRTETFAAVRLEVNNWRWGKTPFLLRAGKRLPRRVTEAAIHFRRPPHRLFEGGAPRQRNVLLLRIQPDEGISMRFGSKVPGPELRLRDVLMDFRYGVAFGGRSPDAYERLLSDAMLGDATLFARRDEVDEAWRIVDSIASGWREGAAPLPYAAGTWGPDAANELLAGNREWRRP
ncbi:MAG: glucose-6-phosphate dehydrogenase [Planctomycetota bacterium]